MVLENFGTLDRIRWNSGDIILNSRGNVAKISTVSPEFIKRGKEAGGSLQIEERIGQTGILKVKFKI